MRRTHRPFCLVAAAFVTPALLVGRLHPSVSDQAIASPFQTPDPPQRILWVDCAQFHCARIRICFAQLLGYAWQRRSGTCAVLMTSVAFIMLALGTMP
ncbi:MAG: hypothetical protein C7B46_02710 [Sulfobacillus benefaciens]|uniref:Uncharacterized protein n=1 Tax=Sulfobacillus benefaciens TaxID=453960 RepID=A0A2T2XKR5_9FIRM|nr:MAG: hypothetical protein C7B46_02710 [Sulfobacillus benefaciens]